MGKILPLVLLLIGSGAGVGAGVYLRPSMGEELSADHNSAELAVAKMDAKDPKEPNAAREYVKLNNQFVIPLVEKGAVSALVVMSLSVEVLPGNREDIFSREPKLRDSFLQVLFDHANVGGFRNALTDNDSLQVLRSGLRDVAIRDAGDHVTDVLILEIARQDY